MKVHLGKSRSHGNIMAQEMAGLNCKKEAFSFSLEPNLQMAQGWWYTRRADWGWSRHIQRHFVKYKAQARRASSRNEWHKADPVFHLWARSTSDECFQTIFPQCCACFPNSSFPRKKTEEFYTCILLYLWQKYSDGHLQFMYNLSLNALCEGILLFFMCKTSFKMVGETLNLKLQKPFWFFPELILLFVLWFLSKENQGCLLLVTVVYQVRCPLWKSRGCCPV